MTARRSLAAVVLLLSTIGCNSPDTKRADAGIPAAASSGEVGQPAPPYRAISLAGDSVSLAAYRGKIVLMNVWATWCGPCRVEIPELRVIDSAYRNRGLYVIGVTIDAEGMQGQITDFVSEFRMGYPIWRDPNERVSAQFRIVGVPSSFLIDRAGIVRWRSTGPIAPGDTALSGAIRRALE